ncbi:autotransporter-associated beta strand repeat-containing protein [Luteolibacter flavescens]|uniref:Autotransporter-associated beta strand repeat-containing protein n=1 Tax=Luteolibacter flavescens TaxID=1859460 RepID=A0ABT3FX06_9BACT|nr:autotransporter-associated beta strand repeat-containing protein [Luteolibacter flavescens]MCW1887764.1 autotransporter-associated beta strand repeat-containing protein [Luteolibacter flavescens]
MKSRLPLSTTDSRLPLYVASLAGCLATTTSLHALDYTWTGATSNVSNLPANWNVAGAPATAAPGVADNILIDTSTPNPTNVPAGNWSRQGAGTTTISGTGIVNVITGSGRFLNNGVFNLSGGQLNQTGEYFIVANPSTTGVFNHTGGTLNSTTTRGFFISDGGGALGSTYNLAGGTMNVISTATGNSSADDRRLRSVWFGKGGENLVASGVTGDTFRITSGTATFTKTHATAASDILVSRNSAILLEGGNVTFDKYNEVRLGFGTTNLGTTASGANNNRLSISGGTLNITGGTNVRVGYADAGLLQMSGGELNLAGTINVGIVGTTGTLAMTGGTVNVTTPGTHVIGGGSNGNATVSLSGNSVFSAPTSKWKTGDFGGNANGGVSSISLTDNAALTLKELTVAHIGRGANTTSEPPVPAAEASFTMGGTSSLTVSDFITIGRDDNTAQSGIIGSLNLNGGTLSTQYIVKGSDTSTAAKNMVNANGGTIKALVEQPDFFKLSTNVAGRVYVNVQDGGLNFDTNGFNVGIQTPLNGTGVLTKSGAGTLNLAANTSTLGGAQVNAGTLQVTTGNSLPGPVNVASGAALAVNGSPSAEWRIKDLNLSGGSSISINNLDVYNGISPAIYTTDSLNPTGTVSLNINGVFGVNDFPLIAYPEGGSIGGAGLSAFQLGTLPRSIVANLVDDTVNHALTLRVTAVNPLVWRGNSGNVWDVNTTTNWSLLSATEKYLNGDVVLFNDTVTGGPEVSVVLDAAVTPQSVTFSNESKNYTLSGTGSIGGNAPIRHLGGSKVTLLTQNPTTGTTTVDYGTMQFGNGTVSGSVGGNLMNSGTMIFHPAETTTFPGSIDGYGTFIKNGPATLILTPATNTSGGEFKVNEGTVQFGNGISNGLFGNMQLDLAAGTTLRVNQAVNAATGTMPTSIRGAGDLVISPTQSIVTGNLTLSEEFTGIVRVEKGRVDARLGEASFGGASKVQVLSGAQLLAFTSTDPYNQPVEIAGTGSGEPGFPGALRLAGNATATWSGSVTLTAPATIMAQFNSNFTISGPITGDHQAEFNANTGTVIVNPTTPGQNTYASTKVTGASTSYVTAGKAQAFSTGPLVVDSAILKLDGYNQSFASLAGAGGAIGNYHASTPATITVGSGNASTSYAGVIRDGAAAPLALVKVGTGTQTLTAATAYTGNTTVSEGKLVLAASALADTSTVTIATGAVLELTADVDDVVGALVLGGTNVGPGTYDTTHPTYGAYFSGPGSLVIEGVAGFDAWAASMGLDGTPGKENGPNDDPDHDGIANVIEFFLDGNPLAGDRSILPASTLDANYLTLTFRRRDDASTSVASQAIQYGSTLNGWTDVVLGTTGGTDANGVIVTIADNGTAADDITVQIPRALAVGNKLFGRLSVTK